MSTVTYEAFTSRNAGFVRPDEQEQLRRSSVFVCGVGGMGGAAVQSLVRAGVGRIGIADFDVFEPTNLNRQLLASTTSLGRPKTEVTAEALRAVNPELCVRAYGEEWSRRLDDILPGYDVVVNGMDDVRAAVALYRAARRHRVTVVDSWVSPSPSVYVVGPRDPRPEEWLHFPTRGLPLDEVADEDVVTALLKELAFVAASSRGFRRIPLPLVGQILRGERPRPSFAPVVIISGNLMANEAMSALLGRTSGAGYRGYFLDLASGRVERPRAGVLHDWRQRMEYQCLSRLAGRNGR